MEPPVQGWFYVRRTPEIEIAAVLVRHKPDAADGEVHAYELTEETDLQGNGTLRELWEISERMRANWTPEREPEAPLEAYQIRRSSRADCNVRAGEAIVAGGLKALDPQKIVDFDFRDEPQAGPHSPVPLVSGPHIHAAGEDREDVATDRYLDSPNGPNLLAQLGLPGAWWCALRFSRERVLGERRDGDIDIVAGPLELELTADERKQRIADEAKRNRLDTPPGLIASDAMERAALEGHVRWPPRMDYVVACEVKASWFDTESGVWKRTQTGQATKIRGQLELLVDHGFNRVGFFHVSATRPRELGSGNPWLVASGDSAEAADTFTQVVSPDMLPTVGLFSTVMGAVAHKTEEFSGSGGVLVAHQPAQLTTGSGQAWRAALQKQMALLKRPPLLRVFVKECRECHEWEMIAHATAPCARCAKS
jgi:hypothetical protein